MVVDDEDDVHLRGYIATHVDPKIFFDADGRASQHVVTPTYAHLTQLAATCADITRDVEITTVIKFYNGLCRDFIKCCDASQTQNAKKGIFVGGRKSHKKVLFISWHPQV